MRGCLSPLTKKTLFELCRVLNEDFIPITGKGYNLAIYNDKKDVYEILAFFKTHAAAKKARRILRSVMSKAFSEVYEINIVKNSDI